MPSARPALELLLFDAVGRRHAGRRSSPRPRTPTARGRTGTRSCPGIGAGQVYALRAHGPFAPERGLRFDADAVLLDPYGRGVAVPTATARGPRPRAAGSMKSVVVDVAAYDWEGDRPLGRPFGETVIYEAHVRGFTAAPELRRRRGAARDLRRLHRDASRTSSTSGSRPSSCCRCSQFDAQAAPGRPGRTTGATSRSRSSRPTRRTPAGRARRPPLDEFRDLVKALHRAGIEVILDVVYNHTAEGGADGPTFCFRGLANDDVLPARPRRPRRATPTSRGCGNTLNANDPSSAG